jgi:hypothetical protein
VPAAAIESWQELRYAGLTMPSLRYMCVGGGGNSAGVEHYWRVSEMDVRKLLRNRLSWMTHGPSVAQSYSTDSQPVTHSREAGFYLFTVWYPQYNPL